MHMDDLKDWLSRTEEDEEKEIVMGSLSVVTTESPSLLNADPEELRETNTIIIRNCRTSGLGIKIIGGKSTVGGADYGVFVKKILVGGRAEAEGHLREGDQLLEANGESMLGVSNDKAISVLRNAADSNNARLIISRDRHARQEFAALMLAINHGKLMSSNSFGSLNGPGAMELMRSVSKDSSRASTPSPTMEKRSWVMSGGRMSPLALGRHGSPNWSPSNSLDRASVGLRRMQAVDYPSAADLHTTGSLDPPPYHNSNSLLRLSHGNLPSTSNRNGTQAAAYTRHMNGDTHLTGVPPKHGGTEQQSDSEATIDSGLPTDRRSTSSSPTFDNPGELQVITIAVTTGLGLCIIGGTNRPEGPHLFVDNMIDGGDAQRDNRLQRGDQLVTVNGETLVGLTHEQAKSLLTRLKLRKDLTEVEIAFIRGGHSSSSGYNPSNTLANGHSPSRSPVNGLSLHQNQLADLHDQIDSNPSSSRSSVDNGPDLSNSEAYMNELLQASSGGSGVNTLSDLPNASSGVTPQYPGYPTTDSNPLPGVMLPVMNQAQAGGPSPFERTSIQSLPVHNGPMHLPPTVVPRGMAGGFQPTMSSTPTTAVNGLPYGQTLQMPYVSQAAPGQLIGITPVRTPALPSHIQQQYSLPRGSFEISPVNATLQPSSVPFYLQQDLEALGRVSHQYSPPSMSQQSSPRGLSQQSPPGGQQSGRQRQSRHERSSRRLSLDPYTRLKVEKLEVALRYLGFEPTEDQQRELRARLRIDQNGCATYGDFVSTARQIFSMRLSEPNLNTSAMQFALQDISALEKQQEKKLQMQVESDQLAEVEAASRRTAEDIEKIRRERDEALREVQHLRKLLKKKEDECLDTSEEVMKSRQESQVLLEESRSLQNRIHLASEAQRAAKNMEQDYEEVVNLLEKELASFKAKLGQKGPDPKELEELQKRLVVLGCQLRKAEVGKRTYEVATEKLIHFAEIVHDVLSEGGLGMPQPRGKGEAARKDTSGSARPPSYLARHAKFNPSSLAKEARDTVKSIKALIEEEPLPFGWEEAYTPDGVRYYINHVTQQTSWLHPVSQVQHLPAIMEKNEDGERETRT